MSKILLGIHIYPKGNFSTILVEINIFIELGQRL